MRIISMLRARVRSLTRRATADRDLDRELAFHLEQLTEENIRAGMTREEARLAARREFGNAGVLAEECRDHRGWGWLDAFWNDLRFAARLLRRSPGFVLVAAITLGLGVGATIGIYALAEALVLRCLPFPRADRLVTLRSIHKTAGDSGVGQQEVRDWQAANTVFESIAYTEYDARTLTGHGDPERVIGTAVSPGFFEILGVEPRLGRWFLPEEQKLGGPYAVLLSHGLWRRKLGSREDVVGRVLTLDGRAYRIAGIMPPDFRFNDGRLVEYWVRIDYRNEGRKNHQYGAYARLKDGVSVRAAQAQMREIARRLEQAYPETNSGWTVRVTSLRGMLLAGAGPAVPVAAIVVLAVLLIGCANVAGLLLARHLVRAKELAVRLALGAGRWRVFRLLLAESLLVSGLGALAGLAFAYALVQVVVAASPDWLALGDAVTVSPSMVVFTLFVTLLTGLITGCWPALRYSRLNVNRNLKESGGALVSGRGQRRALDALVVVEIALSVVLLSFAGLLIKSFGNLLRTDLGFRPDRLLTFSLRPPASCDSPQAVRQFYERLLERLAALPGVASVAASDATPLSGWNGCGEVRIVGRNPGGDWRSRCVGSHVVTAGYFRALGIPLVAGREFGRTDLPNSEQVAVVNRAFVRRFFGDDNPIGARIDTEGHSAPLRIVGVAGDVRHSGPSEPVAPMIYGAFTQWPYVQFLALRSALPPERLIPAVRSVVRGLDRNLAIMKVQTMNETVAHETEFQRNITTLVSVFALIALGLAIVGLTGTMLYRTAQHVRETGLRMALGAGRRAVFLQVLRESGRLTGIGLALGVATALASARVLGSLLFGVRPGDPQVLLAVPALLAAVATAACLLPAGRAASVDPMTALRQE